MYCNKQITVEQIGRIFVIDFCLNTGKNVIKYKIS
jgi:hypothetical protein